MKKVLSTLALMACIMMALPAQAQLKFGLKGGLNISKVTFSASDINSDNRAGFFIGPMAEFTIPVIGVGIDAAALYTQSGAKVEYENESYDKNLKTIEIPVNLKYNFGLGSMAGVYVAAGPQFGFNVGSGHLGDYDIKDCNTTFNVGAGVKLMSHLQIGVNYNFSINKVAKYEEEGKKYDMKKNTWQVSLAYLF